MKCLTIYHNPRCSNSRKALQLLKEFGLTPRIVPYLDTPLNATEIETLMDGYDGAPADFVRFKEPQAADLGLHPGSNRAEIISALTTTPALMQRPIVWSDGVTIIARPPEKLRDGLTRDAEKSNHEA